MPTPGQMAAQGSSLPPELLAQIPERRGSLIGGGPQVMSQQESSLIGQVAALREEIAELRRLLSPPSAVTITSASMRQAVAQADQMLAVDLCSNCLTPDACCLRGQCGHNLRERA